MLDLYIDDRHIARLYPNGDLEEAKCRALDFPGVTRVEANRHPSCSVRLPEVSHD